MSSVFVFICKYMVYFKDHNVDRFIAVTASVFSICTSITIIIAFIFAIIRFWDYVKGIAFDIILFERPLPKENTGIAGFVALNIGNHSERVKFIEIQKVEFIPVNGSRKDAEAFRRITEKEICNWYDFDKEIEEAKEKGEKGKWFARDKIPYILKLAPKNWANFIVGFGADTLVAAGAKIRILYRDGHKVKVYTYSL